MITKRREIKKLQQALIEQRANHILDMDEAYPDIGMGMSRNTAQREAIQKLKTEGLIPKSFDEDEYLKEKNMT